ncbi:hypothetical protein [Hymenobacter edaphi]|uniref:Conjugal transfer protein TraO n=1 Tax=Hymenobacter edaphi TaxID=2211146 RepID=A0A328BTX3_9BACT|nr:hypothetical protein [Hymenobacter edaphi]RAK70513.1 hypothetical protein DLM85_06675 [Hymenobacter edaphi]
MQLLYPLALAVSLSLPALAQTAPSTRPAPRNLVEFGAGRSLNGSGDYFCQKFHVGYARTLGRHFSVGPRLALINGSTDIYFGQGATLPITYRAINLEGEAYYAPFGYERRFVFAFGAGAYVGHTRQHDFYYAGWGRNANNEWVFDSRPRNTQGFHVGYLASLNADYVVDDEQRWLLGAKLALQNDTYGNILPGAQLRLARRF